MGICGLSNENVFDVPGERTLGFMTSSLFQWWAWKVPASISYGITLELSGDGLDELLALRAECSMELDDTLR